MIILLKIILAIFILIGGIVFKTLYKDYKLMKKTQQFEDSTIADRIKIQSILFFSLTTIFVFCLLLLYYVIYPMQITMW